MRLQDILVNESTVAGGIATVAMPLGAVQRRSGIGQGVYANSLSKPKKKSKKSLKEANEALDFRIMSMAHDLGDDFGQDPTTVAIIAKELQISPEQIRAALTKTDESVLEGVNAKQIKKDLDSGMSYDAVIGKHANKRMTNTDEIRRVIQQHAWEKRMKQPKEQGVAEGSDGTSKLARIATKAAQQVINDVDRKILLRAAKLFAAGKKEAGLEVIERMDDHARDDFYMQLALSGVKLPVEEAIPSHIRPSDIPPAMRNRRLTMRDIEAERPKGAYRYRVMPLAQGESPKDFLDQAAAQAFARQVGGRVQPLGEMKKKIGVKEGIMKQLMHKDAERMSLKQFCEKYGNNEWVVEFYRDINDPIDSTNRDRSHWDFGHALESKIPTKSKVK